MVIARSLLFSIASRCDSVSSNTHNLDEKQNQSQSQLPGVFSLAWHRLHSIDLVVVIGLLHCFGLLSLTEEIALVFLFTTLSSVES